MSRAKAIAHEGKKLREVFERSQLARAALDGKPQATLLPDTTPDTPKAKRTRLPRKPMGESRVGKTADSPKPKRVRKQKALPMQAIVQIEHLARLYGDVTDRWKDLQFAWHTTMPRPNVIAFDVGNMTGWACLGGTNAIDAYRGGAFAFNSTVIRQLIREAKTLSNGPLLVVVEDVFAKFNLAVTFGLARKVGAILAIAELEGLPCLRVLAHAWQSVMFGGHRLSRDDGKAKSLEMARQRVSKTIVTDHASDAALMALFVQQGKI